VAACGDGRRQLGFVTGEAGIGKTTLVRDRLRNFRRTPGTHVRIARGQCIEQYGGGEPYLPMLQAIAELRKGSEGTTIEEALRRHAPRWLVDSVARADADHDTPVARGAYEHTLHMLAATFDALAEDTPLVLVLEDVHWSDYSTLDLLSVLARTARRHGCSCLYAAARRRDRARPPADRRQTGSCATESAGRSCSAGCRRRMSRAISRCDFPTRRYPPSCLRCSSSGVTAARSRWCR
jgi:hypothetical protein